MEQSATIRLVLFDMDGVLVDVSGSYRKAIAETVYHFTGREVTDAQVQRLKNEGGYNDDWKVSHALILDAGMEVSFGRVVDEFQRRYRGDAWNGLIAHEAPLVTEETLLALRAGRVMGVVTGRPEAEARFTLHAMGWKGLFPLLVPMEKQERRGKPDPFPLQRALAMLAACGVRVHPHEAVYIGDTGDDMIAARAAGMWAVGHVPPYLPAAHADFLTATGAHCVIHRMEDLPGILGTLRTEAEAEMVAA